MGETRQPRQTRSQATKEKILESAYKLFCERGYYQTTTNHIADVGGRFDREPLFVLQRP